MTLGNFLLFNSLIYYFTEPLKNILELEPNINYLKNIYRRINDLLLVSTEETNKTDKIIRGNIVIKNLYYLVNEKELFSNVSFKIKYGSKFLIYGNSGNGKSTIIKILLKYLNDYKGNIFIDNKSGAPIYDQIYSQIKAQIIGGDLQEDESLPSIRSLAKDLRISVITTKRAYEELEKEGFIYTVAGKGSFVAPKNVELLREENLKKIEGYIQEIRKLAMPCGLSLEDIIEMFRILEEDE